MKTEDLLVKKKNLFFMFLRYNVASNWIERTKNIKSCLILIHKLTWEKQTNRQHLFILYKQSNRCLSVQNYIEGLKKYLNNCICMTQKVYYS